MLLLERHGIAVSSVSSSAGSGKGAEEQFDAPHLPAGVDRWWADRENVGKSQSCMVSNLRMDYRWAGDGAWPTVSVLVPTCFHRRQLHPQVNM